MIRWALVLIGLGGCPKPAVVAQEPLPDDVPTPRTEGPVAGPRYVVDAAAPPAVPPEVPGQGGLSPYVSQIRRELADRMGGCTTATSGNGALVHLVLRTDGNVQTGLVARTSGDAAWDECAKVSLEWGAFPPPPPGLLDGGVFTTDLHFR